MVTTTPASIIAGEKVEVDEPVLDIRKLQIL
jgi:hypothetical protein